ncbi:MAG TPA: dihydrodipicolinate synthase family protein [Pyrinomonadaceae bacterium]|nr:dihydrodipicolinate synthase family protein [Pyrinomonadaceae bacterium]
MKNLQGILLPFPTPFERGESVDLRAVRSNIERWNETGVVGYVALGSTGERVHLSEREYLEVIEAARMAVPESLALIVGAGQQSMRGSIDEVRRAAQAGADAVLVITPHFYRGAMTQGALFDYYRAVADAASVPLMLYSMPDLTGVAMAPELVARLSEHENIIGIKDSSGDAINLAETLRQVPSEFKVVTGSGPLLYAALNAGACGAIIAVGCVAPQLAVALYRAVAAGEQERAREMQRRLTPLALAVTKRYGIGGLKAAMEMLGYTVGPVRAPLKVADEEARGELARLIREARLLDQETGRDEQVRLAGVLNQ